MGLPKVADKEGIRWITFNRPEIRNALTVEDLRLVQESVSESNKDIRAIVITGTGDLAFTAGMHIETFSGITVDQARERITAIRDCVGAVRLCPKPTIAAVNGVCIGAGFEMALACDIRIAHPSVRFGLPEVKLGIPSVVDASLLQHHVGLSKAKEIILTGDLFGIDDCTTSPLFNKIVAPEAVIAEAHRTAGKLSEHTAEVIAAQKILFETWLNTSLQEGIDISVDIFAELFSNQTTHDAIARYAPSAANRKN
ncbi:enoyl-CoA hydratase/isomerase family protein [Rhodococcus sp. KBW08]|uniref:enoyl-CoA hydratase/isomerase family protein n=1 Tax=Rhodococcus sp. KBW08 TaxID=2144188 RepID=UPI0016284FFB|nr:enoyl-CoA hydratase/isomerase family protein [Rhodococcus sp. KBW08]